MNTNRVALAFGSDTILFHSVIIQEDAVESHNSLQDVLLLLEMIWFLVGFCSNAS